MYRRFTEDILHLDIGTLVEQEPYNSLVPFFGGLIYRRFTEGILYLDIGTLIEQEPYNSLVPYFGGLM
jgi:hypothetical protein